MGSSKADTLRLDVGGGQLAAGFARRMAPMALLVGVVVAVVPPLLYGAMSWQRLESQASVLADHLALALSPVAARQPILWRYNARKVIEATAGHRGLQELGSVRITDCAGQVLFSGEALGIGRGTGFERGPVGWAPVVVSGSVVAWAQVTMDRASISAGVARLGLASLALGLVLGLVLFVLPTRVVRRQASALESALGEVASAEARLVEANVDLQRRVEEAVQEVRTLSGRVVSIQETERRRIALDLHDGVGQLAAALKMELEIAGPGPEKTEPHSRALGLCDTIVSEIRHIARDLRPLELESAGLEGALRGFTERFEVRTGIATSFRVEGGAIDSEEASVCLLRVAQEALTNVGRHAGATEVGVRLIAEGEGVTLDVEDDGCGFEPGGEGEGSGLSGMRERLAFLGGHLSVEAVPGEGVRLRAHIPVGRKGVQ